MSNAKMEIKYVGPAAAEQLISNINNALDTKQPKGDYLVQNDLANVIDTALGQAKSSGEFDGQRGTGILKVTSSLTSYTTSTNGVTPIKRMALSTIKSQAGVSVVLPGDIISHSYYHYHIYYVDATYAYVDSYVSVRGAAGSQGGQGPAGNGIVSISIEEA